MTRESPSSRSRSDAMSPADWAQLESMVDALLDTPSQRRGALLAELSGGDANRRAELERLLSECKRPHPLLDQPAARHSRRWSTNTPSTYRTRCATAMITREIGRGGMATVYLARDLLRHSRDVAVKVLRPELAAAVGGSRFLREIEIAARLRHPNIVPLYDSGWVPAAETGFTVVTRPPRPAFSPCAASSDEKRSTSVADTDSGTGALALCPCIERQRLAAAVASHHSVASELAVAHTIDEVAVHSEVDACGEAAEPSTDLRHQANELVHVPVERRQAVQQRIRDRGARPSVGRSTRLCRLDDVYGTQCLCRRLEDDVERPRLTEIDVDAVARDRSEAQATDGDHVRTADVEAERKNRPLWVVVAR